MYIKDLIKQLQDLESSYDDEYRKVMGEPEIMIDVFRETEIPHHFRYVGFSPNIIIDKSKDGIYDILTAFEIKLDSPT